MDPADRDELERFVEIGSTLKEKYRIERVLGVGGMGVVVAAEHLKLGEKVAIKFLLPRALGQRRNAQRFLREARSACKLRSAHVARVFDVDVRADGAPFIVMEYLTGETLGARLKREERFEIAHAVDHLLEACEAIAEAHLLGIVHRDLKPANLFLARGAGSHELLKVLDFGISKVVDTDAKDHEATTGDGFVGSPPYMSPEQLTEPTRVDRRSDIWSLGVILYECLTGKAPFKADGVGEVLALILQNKPASVRELRPDVPESLASILERCLEKRREARYSDIASLARDLAPHGTERGRRVLAVIDAVSLNTDVGAPTPVSEPPVVQTGPGLDTGTLSAAAEGARPSSVSTRRESRLKLALVGLAMVAIVIAVFVSRSRSSLHEAAPRAAVNDAAAIPLATVDIDRGPPAAVAPSPSAEGSSAPASSVRQKSRRITAPNAATPAPSGARSFDPVFDERR